MSDDPTAKNDTNQPLTHADIDRLAGLEGEAWWQEWTRLSRLAPSVSDEPAPEDQGRSAQRRA